MTTSLQSHNAIFNYVPLVVYVCIHIYSNPVRVCVSVRGLLPTGASVRFAQQHH